MSICTSPPDSPAPAPETGRPVAVDTGTAYDRKARAHDPVLTEVGGGTPMGELLRRYWHPVGLVTDATDIPRKVRVLGEDLSACSTPAAAAISAPRSTAAGCFTG